MGWTVPISLFAYWMLTRVVSSRNAAARSAAETRPPASDGQHRHLEPVDALEECDGLEHGLVLDRRGDDVAPARRRQGDALDGQVVGLGAARGEDHVAGAASGHAGDLGAGLAQGAGGGLADGVHARRVAEAAGEVRPHRLDRLPPHRCRRGVVEVDHGESVVADAGAAAGAASIAVATRLDHDVEPEVEGAHASASGRRPR